MIYGHCNNCGKKGKTHPFINPHFGYREPNVLLCTDCVKLAAELVFKWVGLK